MKKLIFVLALISFLSQAQYTQLGSKLVGSGSNGAAWQGTSVDLSADGKTAIVGGYLDNSGVGAAWIYTFNGTSFVQLGNKLVGTGYIGASNQGWSVGISADGKKAVVGGMHDNSIGATWVYTFNGTNFVQAGSKLVGTGATTNGSQGTSVAISGDGNTIVVGGSYNDATVGATWIFTFNGNAFVQVGTKLSGSDHVGSANQGCSVDISSNGKTVISGGRWDNSNVGAAWIYTFDGTSFIQAGNKLIGSGNIGASWQGNSVCISGDGKTAVLGGTSDDSNTGAIWVYTFNGSNYVQVGTKLKGIGEVGAAGFGFSSISMDGKKIAIGGGDDNSGVGAVWVYTFDGTGYSPSANKLIGTGSTGNARLGYLTQISADGNTIISGGIYDNSNAGAAWVFVTTTTSCSFPVIIAKSSSISACLGSPQSLSVTASGTSLTYQWYFNGSIMPGETNSTLSMFTAANNTGDYTCKISNVCGSITTSVINVSSLYTPELIINNDNLLAVKNPSAQSSYQWIKNGIDEPGQNTPIHTSQLMNTEYQVRVSLIGCASITSDPVSIFKSIQVTTVTVVEVITATSCNTVSGNARMENPSDIISMEIDSKTGKLLVNAPAQSISKIEISDQEGKLISSSPQISSVDLHDKPHGTYTIKALNRQGSILKMVKIRL